MPRRSPTRPPLPRGRLGSRLLRGAVAADVPVALADGAAAADSLQVATSVVLADTATAADSFTAVRGFPWWVATGTVATSADTASLQAVLPTGYTTGDLLVLDAFHAGPDTVTQNTDMAALGWTLQAHATPSGAFGHLWRYTKPAASGSEAAPTLTFSAANGVVIAVTAIREPGTLASTLTAVDAASNTTPITAPTLTVTANSLILVAYGNRVAAPPMATVTPDPDYTEQVDVPTTNAAGSGGTLEVATRGPLTAGTLSGDTWTPSVAGRDILVITEIRAGGVATPITLADTGAGVDTLAPAAQVALTDRGGATSLEVARGIAVSGGEFGIDGAPLTSAAASVPNFSHLTIGVYDTDYHFDGQTTLNYLAAQGWRHIRVPIRAERLFSAYTASTVTLRQAELDRVIAMLDRINTAGMKGWLDFHNYGYIYSAPNTSTAGTRYPVGGVEFTAAAYADLWGKVAAQLCTHAAIQNGGGYQLMNEPRSTTGGENLTVSMWKTASQAAVTAIRAAEIAAGVTAAAQRAWISVCGYQFGDVWNWATINGSPWITDPAARFRYEGHWYWGGYVGTANHANPHYARYSQEVTNASGQGYAAGTFDALHTRLIGPAASPQSEIQQWSDWFTSNGLSMAEHALVGEFGWNHDHDTRAYDAADVLQTGTFTGDQTAYNTLAGRVLGELDSRRIPWLAWSVGEWYSTGTPPADRLAIYYDSPNGSINTKLPQATVYEAHPTLAATGGDRLTPDAAAALPDAAVAADTLQPVAQVTVADRGQGNDTPPPADPLARSDLIYGSEIGAWLPDGEPAATVAPTPARHARIPVIRFALHDTFTDLLDPLGNAGQIIRADFRHVISAIVGDFHAIPWLKCLPIAKGVIGTKAGNVWCPPWTGTIPAVWLNTYKAMLDEVAKVWRGPIIIESNNEMEYACWETWRDRDGATLTGAGNAGVSTRLGEHFAQTMGELRRYARGLGFSHVVVGGYIGIAGGPQWGATVTADGSKPYSYAFSNLGSTWVNEFNNAVKAAYDAEPAGTQADLVPDFIAIHAYSHGGDFSTSATGYEFTDLTGYDSARPDDIAYSYYRQWLTNARARLVAIWGATIGNQIRLAMSEWNAGLANSTSTWSGWTTSGRPGQFYRGWMTMLAGDGVTTGSGTRWWEASMFLLASESDAGASRYYNTVKQDGTVQVWYYDFRDAAAADPATATGVGPTVAAALPLVDQAAAADLLGVPLFKSLVDAGVAVEAMAGVLTVVGTLLTAGSSPAASGTYLTGSVSPAAGTVLLVWVEHGGTATLPTLSGLGATWTRQGSVAYGDGTRVLSAHTAPIGGGPGSGQLTISGGAMTHAVWSVLQLTDADPTTPVVGSPASGTASAASSLTVPLAAAAAAGNRPFAGFAADDSTPTQTTPRAGWSELSETVV